jgi:hypothetical protein
MGVLYGSVHGLSGSVMSSAQGATRLVLIPGTSAVLVGTAVRVGGVEVTLDATGAFTVNIPNGTYMAEFTFTDPARRARLSLITPSFTVGDSTDFATVLGPALLTGPQTWVIILDTDTYPYYVTDGTGGYGVFKDSDGRPYYSSSAGGESVYFDVDGTPVILTL